MIQFLGVKKVRHGLTSLNTRRQDAHKEYAEPNIQRGLLDRCLEQYDEVSSRPLDKTVESAISRSKTLSIGPAVRGIRVLFETGGDIAEAGDDVTINVQRLYGDVLEKDARAQYGSMGFRVAIFYLIYSAAVVLQRNGATEAYASQSVTSYFAKSRFPSPATPSRTWPPGQFQPCAGGATYLRPPRGLCTTVAYKMLGFLDIQSIDDFWDWLPTHFAPMWYANQRGDDLQKFRAADGFRLVQRRGFTDSECVTRFSGPIRAFSDPFCYDRLPRCSVDECILGGGEDRRPFGILANRSRYAYQSYSLPSGGEEGGYFQFFPADDEAAGRAQVAQLKHDRWMDTEAQWARLDFPLLVADQALLIDLRLLLDVDPSGRVTPFVLLDAFRLTWYDFSRSEDAVRAALEVLTLVLWGLQIYDAVRDFTRCRARFRSLSRVEMWNRYRASPYFSPVRDFQILLFLIIFALWLAIIADPTRTGIVVDSARLLGPGGKPLFMTQSGKLVRAYFLLNGFNCLLFTFRFLASAKMHPRIAELCTALGAQLPVFSWFATVLFIVMWLFSLQAIVMFGNAVVTASDFGGALASTTQMSWSKVVNSRSFDSELNSSPVAVSRRKGIGYMDLRTVSPTAAWLYYYPLVIVTWMFLMLATIPFIVDGYDLAKRQRAETLRNKKKAVRTDNASSMAIVARTNLARLLTRTLGYNPLASVHGIDREKLSRRDALTNDNVLRFCESLPEEMYGQCTTVGDLKNCAEKQGFTSSMVDNIMEFYPYVVNDVEDLKRFIVLRVPPASKTDANRGISEGEELLEQYANIQTALHAKLDQLIQFSTV